MATLKITHDDDNQFSNPRDGCNLGVMACWHKRRTLGDDRKTRFAETPAKDWLEPWGTSALLPKEWEASLPKGTISLPMFMFDHSGITIRTSSESFRAQDPQKFDWGQLGVIVATPEAIMKWFKVLELTDEVLKKAYVVLELEVKLYDQYLRGEVWGYEFIGDDDVKESCWGYLGETLEETGLAHAVPEAAKPLLKDAWEARQ